VPGLWSENVCEEDRPEVERLRQESFRGGNEFIAEYRVRHKDGHIVYVADHSIPFQSVDGSVRSVDGIIMDVTGRVKLQERLIRSEGLKTVSEVSARLAHEIRNPLMSAGGFARRLLSSMDEDDPNRGKVEIIVKEVNRLEVILRMILNYIHPLELYKSPVDPNDLVERALSVVEEEIRERRVRVELQLAPSLPKISADRPQMELAVETLVKNALNQMEEGATLFISTFREHETLRLVMRYPVFHMSPDDVEHFFYPFTLSPTAYDTTDLPMSKILVHKHGGMIDVRLEPSHLLFIEISLPI
jgi:nitrogen-specific signal transduction histidine kinase